MSNKLIGGFFGLDLDLLQETKDSVWAHWTKDTSCALGFENARSALAYLFDQKKPRTIWLPSYICRDVMAGDGAYNFYPADPLNGTDTGFLSRNVADGDAVVVVNYFGHTPSPAMLDFIKSCPDILWVEDRCHTLWSEIPVYGDWAVYSPRKVLGVADGGLLVSYRDELSPPDFAPAQTPAQTPARMRYEDKDQNQNGLWYPAYQKVEAEMTVSLHPLSGESLNILQNLPISSLIKFRKRNAAILRQYLEGIKGVQILPSGDAPFCVPVLLESADAADIASRMAKNKVFCARHWADLAVPPEKSPQSHDLARKLLSLPCDHRYDERDMKIVADTLENTLSTLT